jgi:RND family efflux transporter MFP subunit
MKKIVLALFVAASAVACKKNNTTSQKLDVLIKNKDVKGMQAYKELQKSKMDSLNKEIAKIDETLNSMGVTEVNTVVSVLKMQPTNFIHNIEIQGNVTTDQDITITPQFSGILALYVKEGQRVAAGQIIGKISDGGLQDQLKQAQINVAAINAQLQQAKANENLARITYEKQSALWNQKIGSEYQYLQAKTNYESAQKMVSATESQVSAAQKQADYVKTNLEKTAIIAPFSGVIDKVFVQSGQVVTMTPATAIVKLISLEKMRVEANVPETYLAKVKPGSTVQIFFPTLNKTVNSSVKLTGNYINPQNRTFNVQIPVANEDGIVKPNLLAQVKIADYINPNALQIPSQYIYEDAEHKNYVFTATNVNGDNAIVKKVFVQEGEKSENSVEITTGLNKDDIVITDGSKNLTDGQKVKIGK